MHRTLVSASAALVALLFVVPSALAGGWAVVTLDELPAQVRQGEVIRLGFMVRQHGQTPTNQVQPYLEAFNPETGETFRIEANQEGPVGHFVLELTFPSAGSWEWAVVPAPFAGTQLPALIVLPAPPALLDPAPAPAASPLVDTGRLALRWAGMALLLSAAAAGTYSALGGRLAARSRSQAPASPRSLD